MASKFFDTSNWTDNTYEGMSARSIANNLSSNESARSGFFVLEIDNLDNLIQTNKTGTDAADRMNGEAAKKYLRLHVTKCPVPTYKVNVMEFKRGNDTVKFAGTPTFDGGSITVDDIVGLDTKSILMAWLRLAYDPHTFKGGRMKDYKKTAALLEYTQDYQLVRTWNLYGFFISGLNEGEFDKENDSKRQITAEFSYDYALMETNIEDDWLNNPSAEDQGRY